MIFEGNLKHTKLEV